jgi:Tfp pilus assembly protein PilE
MSLVEVMVVIITTSVLAAVSIPAYSKHVARARVANAEGQLGVIFQDAVAYFNNVQVATGTAGWGMARRFPESQAPMPGPCTTCAQRPGGLCDAARDDVEAWDRPTWQALNFVPEEPDAFVYSFDSVNTENILSPATRGLGSQGSGFTARAQADLDGDGTCSLLERAAIVVDDGSLRGSFGVFRRLPLE